MSDDLHEFKTAFDLPGQGITEEVEKQFKKVTPALGLTGFSKASGKIAANIGILADHYSGGKVMEKVDDNLNTSFDQHLLIFPDWTVNILIVTGLGITIMTDKTTLAPLAVITVLYFFTPQFIRSFKLF